MNRNTRRIITALAAATILLVLSLGIAYAWSITVDGNPADWGSLAALTNDPNEGGISDNTDINPVYMVANTQYLYIRFDTFGNPTRWTPTSPGGTPPFVRICLDSDNNTGTGVNVVGFCSDQQGVDHILTITGSDAGTVSITSFLHCAAGSCSPQPSPDAAAFTLNNVTELQVSLVNLDIPASSCSTNMTIVAALYFDNIIGEPDDSIPDLNQLTYTQVCPTAVTLSNVSASAESNSLPVLPIAALGLVAVAGVVVVTMRRK